MQLYIHKDGLSSENFFTLASSSKKCAKSLMHQINILLFFALDGKVQESDLAHFLEDGKTF